MEELMLVRIDSDYCDYLRKYDSRVPYNYESKKLRPFIGVLFKVNDCMYFAPLSSPKPKHIGLKSKIDLLKIDGGNLGVVNFNNMVPVKENNVKCIDLNSLDCKYRKLLEKQLFWLNRNSCKLYNRAEKLYLKYTNNTLNINKVVLFLDKNNCQVLDITREEESLEEYFLEKVGGKNV